MFTRGPIRGSRKLLLAAVVRGATLRTWMGRRKLATFGTAVLTLFVGYHVVFGHNGLTVYWNKQTNERQLAVELRKKQHENEALRDHIARLQNDPNAIEHQAREELHYTRPGEVIYTLPDMPTPLSDKK